MNRVIMLLSGVVLALVSAQAAASPACPATTAGAAVKEARASLMARPVEEMETEVSADAQAAIERVKDRVVQFVSEAMACAAERDAKELVGVLNSQGDAFSDPALWKADAPPDPRHGNGLHYSVETIPHHPGLLAVVARLAIQCGDDAMLMIFESGGKGWRPVLIRRSAPYSKVSGAFGGFRYAVSPPDAGGRWFVATSRVSPWCTSAWQTLRYDISRPGPAPGRPRIIFGREQSHYLSDEDELTATVDGFEVRHEGAIFDSNYIVRRHIARYSVAGEKVRRIQPVAFNLRDFVDEWIDSPWEEASDWTAPGPRLRAAHQSLTAIKTAMDAALAFGSIRACGRGRHQVEIRQEPLLAKSAADPPWFLIVRGDGPYRVEGAARTGDRACNGADRLEAISAAP